ncbi:hypothetical protein [Bacillus sp. P14.5]|uniref:hypothetical protein n=1 Tax=Bacillus sp. P14.5 TaxID=1983400 RepID=UPI000DEB54AA|nr:hypothetical protein [Bacillus sp. P14.5]
MKFYEKTWFTVLTLLLFFPLGLFLMWRYQKFNKAARIIISIFFGFLIVSNLFGESDTNQSRTTVISEDEVVDVEADTEDPTAEEVAEAEQAEREEQEKADAEAAKKAKEEEAARKAAERKTKRRTIS